MPAELADVRHAAHHVPGNFSRGIDDDGEAAHRFLSERRADETHDVIEIHGAFPGSREYDGKGLRAIGGIEQHADQVQNFLCRARATGENNYAVREAHECLEAFFDVGQDHQLIDDGVRGLGGDDAGLCNTDIPAMLDTLLGVSDGRALHRTFHGSRTTACADVQSTQAHLVPHFLGVLVFLRADRVTTPTYDEVGA